MERKKFLKIIGISAVVLLVLNMIMFALRIISGLVFWGIIVAGALFAFKILPKLKK